MSDDTGTIDLVYIDDDLEFDFVEEVMCVWIGDDIEIDLINDELDDERS